MTTPLVTDVALGTDPTRRHRRRFYSALATVLLLIVLIGFGRTFFLRTFFDVPTVPPYVLLHGAVLTAWFAGLLFQTLLVMSGRTHIHRRFGWVVFSVGVAVVLLTSPIILDLAPRQQTLGAVVDARIIRIVWLDLALVAAFAVFLALGVLLRKHSGWHMRLMLLASITIVSPALGRAWNLLPELREFNSVLVTGGVLLFLVGLALHDLYSLKRIHPATLSGAVFLMALRTVAPMLAASDFGQQFVRGLG